MVAGRALAEDELREAPIRIDTSRTKCRILAESHSSMLAGKQRFDLATLDFGDARVGDTTAAAYASKLVPSDRERFEAAKRTAGKSLAEKTRAAAHVYGIVAEATQPGSNAPFVIEPRVTRVEPGFYDDGTGESRLALRIAIKTTDGALVEELEVEHWTTSGGRFSDDAGRLGPVLASYLDRGDCPQGTD